MIIDKPIVFTRHFKEQAQVIGLPFAVVLKMIPLAEKIKIPQFCTKRYKHVDAHHIQYGQYKFTYVLSTDKGTNFGEFGECYCFITVYDIRQNASVRIMQKLIKQAEPQEENII